MKRPAPLASALVLLVLPLSLTLAWAALHSPGPVPGLVQAASRPCVSGHWVADQVTLRTTPTDTEADLWSSGVLRLEVCGPGTLSFTASGTPAAGQDARLSVALVGQALIDTPVRRPRFFRLRLEHSGWLTLAFPNDLNLPAGPGRPAEDRNLFLKGLKFVPD